MRQIGDSLNSTSFDPSKAGSLPTPSTNRELPAERDANGLPVLYDRECDLEIPRRVFSNWIPTVGPREIVRPLTAIERDKVEGRAQALCKALTPFAVEDIPNVNAHIAAMLSGFRAMRQQDDGAMASVEITRHALREFPLWAIIKGCSLITRKRRGSTPATLPTTRRSASSSRTSSRRTARIWREPRRYSLRRSSSQHHHPPPREQVEAQLGRAIAARPGKPHSPPPLPAGDGKHAERVAADLARRKEQREAS
jgi:hypothetical protein